MSGIKEDVTNYGGGSYGFGGGMYIFAILVVFVILAVVWGGRGHAGGGGGGTAYPVMGGGYPGFGGHGCPDPFTINKLGNLETEVACRTGSIEKQNAVDTGTIVHIMDNQTCQIKEGLAAVINNQNQLAHQAEVMALNNKIADMRANENRLECRINQQETVGIINANNAATNAHISNVQCELNHRLDFIPTKAPTWAASVTPHTFPVGVPLGFPVFDRDRDRCCC